MFDKNKGSLLTVKSAINSDTDCSLFPFSLAIIKNLNDINFSKQVTFFVGENGTGKSTILEAIAYKAGFGIEGGSKNINFKTSLYEKNYTAAQQLADYLTLVWKIERPRYGYFFRAESFFNVASYIDYLAQECGGAEKAFAPYGGKSLHEQSHGESFLSFFKNTVSTNGFYIFDEPEAALSPERQLALLAIIHEKCKKSQAQFIIATHSPILLAYPDATIYSCDSGILESISYRQTSHYQITKHFLDNPERYLYHLLKE